MKKITFWCYQKFLITNCKTFLKLSFVKRILKIKKDNKILQGRFVILEVK